MRTLSRVSSLAFSVLSVPPKDRGKVAELRSRIKGLILSKMKELKDRGESDLDSYHMVMRATIEALGEMFPETDDELISELIVRVIEEISNENPHLIYALKVMRKVGGEEIV